ncbi:MAG: hypothetical protein A2408_01735 [Candidatus Yonathbacteria bacterium RIFOXYC1_FULL_52_10]|uniref:EamA domain-containing protein n=1 Tax=Candidatus Yonathbacteria bacterium RIFOXYD1_FULL_52_36 TaxID=1802730 RepID=A0A1G2SIJ1_9BACT|nr:MAG: hypothetical protein A2408_01735 [Candidatus Yonathbacteria bacterium RIFOXYC1_FULL_52_10]OHA84856.1 MAG: hypothetical protein A2591_00830 [Candidatus Yonathbacteria bacterium RIFOXYD1_FULL_52_36]
MHPLLLLFIGGTILTIGDIVFKFWAINGKHSWYAAGIIVYLIGLLFLVQSFKTTHIATASVMFVIFNVITLAAVSALYFNERLSGVQIIGVGLALLSVVIMELGR